MITLKKRKGENKKMKREKKIGTVTSLTWVGATAARHHKRKEKPLFGSIAENSISARLRDWILVLVFCIVCARGPACGAAD